MENIYIKTEYIKLDQLLKFANITENGADAKFLITEGFVTLNGETEIRRGKKIYPNDIVKIDYEGAKFSLKVLEDDSK